MWRRSAAAVGAVVLAATVLSACDWTMYRAGPSLNGWNAFENTISVSNVGNLRAAFTGTSSQSDGSITVAGGVVYVEGVGTTTSPPELAAFDANGTTDCSGVVPTCTPLWTATLPAGTGHSTPAVANGIVYVSAGDLYAYDAAGTTDCSGTPKVCTPLWEGRVSAANYSSPNIVNGVVYVGGTGSAMLYTFDASGSTNCSGTPKVCQPLWQGSTAAGGSQGAISAPAFANGVVYIAAGDGSLHAFDGSGKTNCSGSPVVCTQLWSAHVGGTAPPPQTAPAVANGTVYYANGTLYAFDAAGVSGCGGTPKVCTPMWTGAGSAISSPAVTNSTVYVGEASFGGQSGVAAFDASGTNGCAGTPKVCNPLWFDSVSGGTVGLGGYSSPTVVNGVLYVGGNDFRAGGGLYAFDAAGTTDCSGTPRTCAPLFTYPVGAGTYVFSDAAVANATVYLRESNLTGDVTNFVALKLP